MHQVAADNGGAAGQRESDRKVPVSFLIEAQNFAGQRHREREQQQQDAADPGEFAWILVRTQHKDLHQVNNQQREKEVGTPVMQRSQIPSERLLIIEIEQ